MDERVAIGGAVVLPATVAAAFALGYARGRRDALYVVWNLRSVAQCLDDFVPPEGEPTDDREEPFRPSRWVWKSGRDAGRPVEHFEHGLSNAF